jgi:hypothetical protein
MRSNASRAVVLVSLSLGLGALFAVAPRRADAQDLQTEPTTKVLSPDPGTTTLTPGGTAKPGASATTSASKGKGAPSATDTAKLPGRPGPTATASASDEPAEPTPAEPPAAASASARVPTGKPVFDRRTVALGAGDLSVSFLAPKDWPELAKAKLPELPPNPDATIVVERGFGVHDPTGKPPELHEVVVACGKASAEYWADNIRDAAFTQMVSGVETEAKKYSDLSSIEPEAQRPAGERIEQPFAAEASLSAGANGSKSKKGAETAKLQGVSFIGFYKDGASTNVIACSIACANLVAGKDQGVCGDIVGSLEVTGSFVPAPKRSWLAQVVFSLKQNPTLMWLSIIGAAFALLLLILVPILLVRRRRAHATGEHDAHDDHDHDHDHDHDDDGYQEGYQAGLAAARAAALAGVEGLKASPPPPEGYFDPSTLARRA